MFECVASRTRVTGTSQVIIMASKKIPRMITKTTVKKKGFVNILFLREKKKKKWFKFHTVQTLSMSLKPQCNGTTSLLPWKDLEKLKESFTE